MYTVNCINIYSWLVIKLKYFHRLKILYEIWNKYEIFILTDLHYYGIILYILNGSNIKKSVFKFKLSRSSSREQSQSVCFFFFKLL